MALKKAVPALAVVSKVLPQSNVDMAKWYLSRILSILILEIDEITDIGSDILVGVYHLFISITE